MGARFQAPRGTQDVLPDRQPYWRAIDTAVRDVCRVYGYQRVDTPAFEHAALFEKGTGDTTDIVEKEMYVFEDRGGEVMALTPEATPAIARAYLEHGMGSWPQPVRLHTVGRMFRYDRPQQGRYRQFTQFDAEAIGSGDPFVDAELIELLWRLYETLGLTGLEVRLSSIDDPLPRRGYVERLKDYYRPNLAKLSEDSQRRFERNPLRLLDSKDERDQPFKQAAPKLVEQLSDEAAEHFERVKGALEAAGIPFVIDPLLVRGLDYYNRTVFEIVPRDDERAQSTVGAGGRYDGLVEVLGGPPTPGIGFATGYERIIIEMEKCGVMPEVPPEAAVFMAHRGEQAAQLAFRLAGALRRRGIPTLMGETGRSFKAQMRRANTSGAALAVIIGDDEVAHGTAVLKNLRDEREQIELPIDQVAATVDRDLQG